MEGLISDQKIPCPPTTTGLGNMKTSLNDHGWGFSMLPSSLLTANFPKERLNVTLLPSSEGNPGS